MRRRGNPTRAHNAGDGEERDVAEPHLALEASRGFGRLGGEVARRGQRAVTEMAWQQFAAATATSFDGLVAALGRPDLASNQKVSAPPDTELSLFTIDNDDEVTALLIESPEPIPWRRVWPWVTLPPADLDR